MPKNPNLIDMTLDEGGGVPSSRAVQSHGVGSTPKIRKKRVKEVQMIKKPQSLKGILNEHIGKLSAGLRI